MNQLRQLMFDELQRRKFADTTIRSYQYGVAHFSRGVFPFTRASENR